MHKTPEKKDLPILTTSLREDAFCSKSLLRRLANHPSAANPYKKPIERTIFIDVVSVDIDLRSRLAELYSWWLSNCQIWTRPGRFCKLNQTMKFYFTTWLSCLLLAVLVSANADAPREPPKTLQIVTDYLPDKCTQKSENGDYISVHYVSPCELMTKRYS